MIQGSQRNLRPPHSFHDRHFKRRADRHDFPRRFHSRAQLSLGIQEFIERPFGKFDDDVIDCGLEAGERLARHIVSDFVERITESDLCRNLRNRVPRRLGGERRRTAHTGIDFDDGIFKRIGIERKLNVTAALYSEFGYNRQSRTAEHLIFFIRKRHRRSNNDRIARMNTDGVKILHGTHGKNVTDSVP